MEDGGGDRVGILVLYKHQYTTCKDITSWNRTEIAKVGVPMMIPCGDGSIQSINNDIKHDEFSLYT